MRDDVGGREDGGGDEDEDDGESDPPKLSTAVRSRIGKAVGGVKPFSFKGGSRKSRR